MTYYFTWLHGGALAPYVLAQLPNERRITLLTPKIGGNYDDFTNFMWYSCQVGRDLIFQVEDAEVNCRVLHVEAACFSVEDRAPTDQPRYDPCLVNANDRFAYVIGGHFKRCCLGSVSRYDTSSDVWQSMPQLNIARAQASACFLGDIIYVICGVGNTTRLNSIERLSTT